MKTARDGQSSDLGRDDKNLGLVQKIAGIYPRLLSIEQSALFLGISPKTIRNGLGPRAKKPFPIRPKRIGRRVLFDRKDLDQYVDCLEYER